jgi:hypothetical protein
MDTTAPSALAFSFDQGVDDIVSAFISFSPPPETPKHASQPSSVNGTLPPYTKDPLAGIDVNDFWPVQDMFSFNNFDQSAVGIDFRNFWPVQDTFFFDGFDQSAVGTTSLSQPPSFTDKCLGSTNIGEAGVSHFQREPPNWEPIDFTGLDVTGQNAYVNLNEDHHNDTIMYDSSE